VSRIDMLVYYWRRWHYHERPLPRVGVRAGAMVPGWALRVVAAACAAGCPLLAGGHTFLPGALAKVAAVVFGLVTLWRPGYEVVCWAIPVSAVLLVTSSRAPFDPVALWVALLGYLALRLAMAAALLPWNGRAQPRAVLTWRDLVIVGLLASIRGVVALSGGNGGTGTAWAVGSMPVTSSSRNFWM